MKKSSRDPRALFEAHLERARSHEAGGQFSLAVKELSEALRIRPRDPSIRHDINRLESVLETTASKTAVWPAERFAAPFNLAVRYWDRNMPTAALKEVCSINSFSIGCALV